LVTIYPRSPAQCTLLGCHSNVSFITPLSDTLAMSDSDIFGPLRADAFLESCYCAAVKCTRRLISGNLSVNFRRRLDESLRNCRCRYDAGCKTYRCIIFYIHLLPIHMVTVLPLFDSFILHGRRSLEVVRDPGATTFSGGIPPWVSIIHRSRIERHHRMRDTFLARSPARNPSGVQANINT